MSRYGNDGGGARRRSGHASSPVMSTNGYSTIDALTERLDKEASLRRHLTRGREAKATTLSSSSLETSPSWNAADVIALYMRHQRHALRSNRTVDSSETRRYPRSSGPSTSPTHHGEERLLASYSPKLLLLGDDAAVRELTAALRANAAETTMTSSIADGSSLGPPGQIHHPLPPPPEVYTIPDAVDGLASLRAELCRWCDVVLLCYHVADPTSFLRLQDDVVPAVIAACSSETAEDEEEEENKSAARESYAPTSLWTNTAELSVSAAWPAVTAPPLILVGLGAEARLRRPTNLQAQWITNADVLAFAAEAGVQRLVELYTNSLRHLQILLQHCRTLRDVGYEELSSPAEQGRRAAQKELGLHALLRAPPPMLELHPGSQTVHVALPPRIPTAASTAPHRSSRSSARSLVEEEADGVQCFFSVSDAADLNTSWATQPTLSVPVSGVLAYSDIFEAYTRCTGRPVQQAAAVQLTACTVVPYLFPSEMVQLRVPTPAAPPTGYVDVVHRCCYVAFPPAAAAGAPRRTLHGHCPTAYNSSEQSGGRERGDVSRVRCVIGDATACVDVPADVPLRDHRLGAPISVCIPIDGEAPYINGQDETDSRDKVGPWMPWPSSTTTACPAPQSSRLLRVVMENSPASASHPSHTSSPAAATFSIPPVLPTPVVTFSPQDHSLRLHVPGYRADQVEIRYTLDGSVPTNVNGALYKDAVLLGGKANPSRDGPAEVRVRAVAFPRLYFASPIAEALIDVTSTSPPHPLPSSSFASSLNSAADAPSLQLQEDEALASTPHVLWASPLRVSTPAPQQLQQPQPAWQRRRSSSPQKDPRSPQRAALSARPRRPSRTRTHSAGSSFAGSDGVAVSSDALTTRSAQLRQAFNAGLYTPPRHPFSQGEGYTPSPRSQRRVVRR